MATLQEAHRIIHLFKGYRADGILRVVGLRNKVLHLVQSFGLLLLRF